MWGLRGDAPLRTSYPVARDPIRVVELFYLVPPTDERTFGDAEVEEGRTVWF